MAATNMTRGPILRQLTGYALPLIAGNCFQLGYNAVDAIIAGRFIGRDALAATGTASPVMNLIILGISGICMGAGVLMSEFFGAGKQEELRRELSTSVLFGLFFSLAVAALGVALTDPLMALLHVPEGIRDITGIYLRITFLGAPFTYFYNALAQALKAVGDSKTPLKFLMLSSCLNAVLDLIFIGWLGFGIVCSATTTVIAEAVSAVLSIAYVQRKVPMLRLSAKEWRIDRGLLRQTLSYGSVTALQQAVQPICKLMIQGQVNTLGVDVMAAFNACTRVDDFAYTPEQSIAQAMTTFIAQNRGAGQHQRIREGFRKGLLLETGYWVLIGTAALLFRQQIVGWFVTGEGSAEVIRLGAQYLGVMSLLYFLPAMTNGVQGFYRGMGFMSMTLLGTCIQAGMRVVFTYLLTPTLGILGIPVASMVGWLLMLAVQVPYYFHYAKVKGLR